MCVDILPERIQRFSLSPINRENICIQGILFSIMALKRPKNYDAQILMMTVNILVNGKCGSLGDYSLHFAGQVLEVKWSKYRCTVC